MPGDVSHDHIVHTARGVTTSRPTAMLGHDANMDEEEQPFTIEDPRLTAIFHTNAGAPALAGDMLLSIPGPTGHTDLRLPSQPNGIAIPSHLIPSYIPIRMRRKTFIVNERMAVGAAGPASHIALVHR